MDLTMIPWPQVGAGSGWLFAGVAVYLVYKGRLVPRSTLEDAIHDRNEWRTESRLKDQQIDEKDTQLRSLAEVGRLQESILLAVRNAQNSGSNS